MIPSRIIQVNLNVSSPCESTYDVVQDVEYFRLGTQKFTTTYDNAIIDVFFHCPAHEGQCEIAYEVAAVDENLPSFSVDWDSEVIFKLVVASIHYLNINMESPCYLYYNTPSQTKHNAYQYYCNLWGISIENKQEITEP